MLYFSTEPSTFTRDFEPKHDTSFVEVHLFNVNLIHLIILYSIKKHVNFIIQFLVVDIQDSSSSPVHRSLSCCHDG